MPTKRRTKKGEKYKGFAVEKGNGERDLSDIKYTSSQPKGPTAKKCKMGGGVGR